MSFGIFFGRSSKGIGWTKVDGTGENDGATFFLPLGVDMNTSKKGSYYNRIRDVIDQILKKESDYESDLAHEFLLRMGVEEGAVTDKPVPTQRKEEDSDHGSPPFTPEQRAPERLDLSWKTAGSAFPKTSSRIGTDYQVGHIPAAGSHNITETGEKLYDQVWDPLRAEAAHALDFAHNTAPQNKKEAGMVLLHWNGYNVDSLEADLKNASPTDGSDWTAEEKKIFEREIFRLRKDFHALSKSMRKSVSSCLTYYLGTFKKSDGYRILKTVCAEERAERQAATDQGLDACSICGRRGELLICDSCDAEYHMTCLVPPLASVPDGDWQCEDCISENFLNARDYLIHNMGLFEALGSIDKRTKLETGDCGQVDISAESESKSGSDSVGLLSESSADEAPFRPTPATVDAMKKFAERINAALSMSSDNRSTESSGADQLGATIGTARRRLSSY